jgi:hypothetical protein
MMMMLGLSLADAVNAPAVIAHIANKIESVFSILVIRLEKRCVER